MCDVASLADTVLFLDVPDTVIARRPPNDGRDWDAQCARCGSSVVFERCHGCGGDGTIDEDDDIVRCPDCNGRCGWYDCASGDEWCGAHPREGREQTPRGDVEWFVIGGAA